MGLGIGPSGNRFIGRSEPQTPAAPVTVELHIDELVLHGFSASDRFHIGDALQRELQRLIGAHGLPALLANRSRIERLDAGSFTIGSGARPHNVGSQVARSLHRRLSTPENASPRAQAQKGQNTQ